VIEELIRRGTMLDLVLTNKEGLVGNVKVTSSLGCSDHEMVEFKILRAARRVHSKLATLEFRTADFGLLRDLLDRVPWDIALEGRQAQKSWSVFKDHRMVGVGRDLCGSSSPPPRRSRVTYSRLHRTTYRRVLNMSRGGDSKISLGNLFQCSVTLRVKKFFLMFRRNFLCFNHLLQAQDRCIPTKRKSGRNTRRPTWMNKDLLAKLKQKKEAYRG